MRPTGVAPSRKRTIASTTSRYAIDCQVGGYAACRYRGRRLHLPIPADDEVTGDISNEAGLQLAISQLETQMRNAAKSFEFERAAALRDRIRGLQQHDLGVIASTAIPALRVADIEVETTTPESGALHLGTHAEAVPGPQVASLAADVCGRARRPTSAALPPLLVARVRARPRRKKRKRARPLA